MIYKRIKVFILLIFVGLPLYAKEVRYLVRSPKALLMGDAYTAIAEDEYTLFYNPAALGRNAGLSFTPINPSIGATNALDDLNRFEDFPSRDTAAISDRVLGYPMYLQLGAFPNLKFGPFGFSAFIQNSTSMVLRNRVHPILDLDYRYDRGFILGYAYSIGKGGKKTPLGFGRKFTKKGQYSTGHRTSFGVAFKKINREGLDESYHLFGTELINVINSGDSDSFLDIRRGLGYSKGTGLGYDVGVEHVYGMPNSELSFGGSILDIGGTRFKRIDGNADIPVQEMIVNIGSAFRQKFTGFHYTLSLDLHPVNHYIDFGRKIHVGLEVGIPVVTAVAGWNGGYFSYGVELDLWPMKIIAGFYGVELGTSYKEEEGDRALIYLSFFDFSYDM